MKKFLPILVILLIPTIASCATLAWDEPVPCPPDATYNVTSYDADGTESAPSNEVTVTETDCSPTTGYKINYTVRGDWTDKKSKDVGNVTTYKTEDIHIKGPALTVTP
jgi:hypothetical protein